MQSTARPDRSETGIAEAVDHIGFHQRPFVGK
jgi:hypothetical protein